MAMATTIEAQLAPQDGVLTGLTVRLRSRQLDEALARGTPAEATAPLALRARGLTKLSRRRVIADGLRRVIGDPCRRVPPSQAHVSPHVGDVIGATNELARLADALASPGPVAARGVAQAWILLTDGNGPLYSANATANLRTRASSAAIHLRLQD